MLLVWHKLIWVACEQVLLSGQAKRERASEGLRKGELATIYHKFSFPPRKPRVSAKRENCHRKRVAGTGELELENTVFLHLVLLRFTPVASNSFSFSSLRSSYTATLSSTYFWIFLPSRIQSGEETDVGRLRFNHSSLHSPGFQN